VTRWRARSFAALRMTSKSEEAPLRQSERRLLERRISTDALASGAGYARTKEY
jgi:hypothetical protein